MSFQGCVEVCPYPDHGTVTGLGFHHVTATISEDDGSVDINNYPSMPGEEHRLNAHVLVCVYICFGHLVELQGLAMACQLAAS